MFVKHGIYFDDKTDLPNSLLSDNISVEKQKTDLILTTDTWHLIMKMICEKQEILDHRKNCDHVKLESCFAAIHSTHMYWY
jgi:hypothetical protein